MALLAPINHIFLQNTNCIRKLQVSSGGGGCAHPLHPPLRCTPIVLTNQITACRILSGILSRHNYDYQNRISKWWWKAVPKLSLNPNPWGINEKNYYSLNRSLAGCTLTLKGIEDETTSFLDGSYYLFIGCIQRDYKNPCRFCRFRALGLGMPRLVSLRLNSNFLSINPDLFTWWTSSLLRLRERTTHREFSLNFFISLNCRRCSKRDKLPLIGKTKL